MQQLQYAFLVLLFVVRVAIVGVFYRSGPFDRLCLSFHSTSSFMCLPPYRPILLFTRAHTTLSARTVSWFWVRSRVPGTLRTDRRSTGTLYPRVLQRIRDTRGD